MINKKVQNYLKLKDIEPLIKQILGLEWGIYSGLEFMSLQAMNVLNEVIPIVHDTYFREAIVTVDLINHIFHEFFF